MQVVAPLDSIASSKTLVGKRRPSGEMAAWETPVPPASIAAIEASRNDIPVFQNENPRLIEGSTVSAIVRMKWPVGQGHTREFALTGVGNVELEPLVRLGRRASDLVRERAEDVAGIKREVTRQRMRMSGE